MFTSIHSCSLSILTVPCQDLNIWNWGKGWWSGVLRGKSQLSLRRVHRVLTGANQDFADLLNSDRQHLMSGRVPFKMEPLQM
jgi:hypothetical protein